MKEARDENTSGGSGDTEVDLDRALNHFSSSLDDLEEAFALFRDFFPQMVSDVEHSFTSPEARDRTRAIHTLKGALSNFYPRTLVAQLQELENRSHTEEPNALRSAWGKALAHLQVFLHQMEATLHQTKREQNAG